MSLVSRHGRRFVLDLEGGTLQLWRKKTSPQRRGFVLDGDSRLLTHQSGEARPEKHGVSPSKWLDLCLTARVGNTDYYYYYYFPFMTAMCLTGN